MRAFIFSLDAFIAFTLALVAIYSLILFSSIHSSYYYLLTQAHFLSRDALYAISTTQCSQTTFNCGFTGEVKNYTVLDRILFGPSNTQKNLVEETIGKTIPTQFGYKLQKSIDDGKSWITIYDTAGSYSTSQHAKNSRKLEVASSTLSFDYASTLEKPVASPYWYNSCGSSKGGKLIVCAAQQPVSKELVPPPGIVLVKLSVYI